jgi:hypothetical protein
VVAGERVIAIVANHSHAAGKSARSRRRRSARAWGGGPTAYAIVRMTLGFRLEPVCASTPLAVSWL